MVVVAILVLVLASLVAAVVQSRESKTSDTAFYAALAPGGAAASESRFYENMDQLTKASSVIVSGRVVDVLHTRTIRNTDESGLSMIGVRVQVDKSVRGDLDAPSVVVEFLGGSGDPSADVENLRSKLPEGRSLWFLRSGRDSVADYRSRMERAERKIPADEETVLAKDLDLYWLMSSQGLYLDGPAGVENPLADDEHRLTPLFAEAAAYASIEALTEKVLKVR